MKIGIRRALCAVLLFCLLVSSQVTFVQAAGKKLPVSVSRQTVKIGKTVRIKTKTEGAAFSSSDTAVATVDGSGRVTGKKTGTAVISVKKKGYRTENINITVTPNGNYPSIPVTLDELGISFKSNSSEAKALVTNKSRSGDVRKMELVCQAEVYHKIKEKVEVQPVSPSVVTGDAVGQQNVDSQPGSLNLPSAVTGDAVGQQDVPMQPDDTNPLSPATGDAVGQQDVPMQSDDTNPPSAATGGAVEPQPATGPAVGQQQDEYIYKWKKEKKNITFHIKQIRAGKTVKASVSGDFGDPDRLKITVKSVKLYTGKLLLGYSKSGNVSVQWGVKDKKAPVITGWVGKNSYNYKDVYMVVYPDRKRDLTKYVKAVDDRDGKVKVKVDTSDVNWKRSGVYKVTFIAKDRSGNTAKETAKVQVRTVKGIDQMADSILSSIIKPSWSDKAKAEAIYRYVRRNYSYVDSNDHASWENSALYGLRYKSGNCFVFYSVSRLLLTRAGIPNIEVKRSAGSSHGHWWNYVYVQGGWYHFDTTPRRILATFCLVTDAQLTGYSRSAGNSHIWNKSLLPAGAKKPISSVKWGRRW